MKKCFKTFSLLMGISFLFFICSCSGSNNRVVVHSYSSVITDNDNAFADKRDGQIYKTVVIGNQTWMAENLNFEPAKESWCYEKTPSNCAIYGRLYSWDAAQKACPEGWHLPSKSELDTLIEYIGKDTAGTQLKANEPNWDGINRYGFNALPGGQRNGTILFFHGFFGAGKYGGWWTTTETTVSYNSPDHSFYGTAGSAPIMTVSSSSVPYIFYMHSKRTSVTPSTGKSGHSVRCIKDD